MSSRKTFTVVRRTVDAVLADLPRPAAFNLRSVAFDVFIGAAGFEERVLGIPRAMVGDGQKVGGHIFVGRYDTNPDDNARRESELLPLLRSLGNEPEFFNADHPEDIRRVLHNRLKARGGEGITNIAFDISGASSTLIFSVIGALADVGIPIDLTIQYASAAEYHDPGEAAHQQSVALWEDRALRETGVRDVDTNELFRGIHHDHLPGFVIALPSMYPARLQRCLSHLGVGPLSGAKDSVFWLLPKTDDAMHQWRQDSIKRSVLELMDSVGSVLPTEVHTYCDIWDYRLCLRLVLEQVDRQEGANTSVIHMGTKIQAVGVALALLARPEVSLVNARPAAFSASSYSAGIGACYQIVIEDLQGTVLRLRSVGMLDIASMD